MATIHPRIACARGSRPTSGAPSPSRRSAGPGQAASWSQRTAFPRRARDRALIPWLAALLGLLSSTAGAAATGYTGSAACSGCHPAEHASWARSGHALAMRPASASAAVAAFDGVERVFPSITVRPRRRGVRHVFDTGLPPGAVPLGWVLGVREVEQFLTPLGRGRWQALSVAFDPQHGEWFDVFPEAPARAAW